ncbi:MAG: dihydrodipicolinate synthase family protein, partial [Sedimentisphaerales bacterium]|nr:dihydrodipicolinate synthase family protein [Sedimentisphaerales bacterium]
KAIAEEVDLPIVLYDIPGRCGAGMTPDTIVRLSKIENIVALKDATGSLDHASQVATQCDLTILSGDDSLTLPIASIGGKGVISVVANIVPADVKAMTDLILAGDLVSARKWHNKLFALCKNLLSLATNPIPIKAAMSMLNLASEEMRLPMVPMEQSKKVILKQTLGEYGLLS